MKNMIMYDFAPHWDRYDHSSFMLRSPMPRVKFKEQSYSIKILDLLQIQKSQAANQSLIMIVVKKCSHVVMS